MLFMFSWVIDFMLLKERRTSTSMASDTVLGRSIFACCLNISYSSCTLLVSILRILSHRCALLLLRVF